MFKQRKIPVDNSEWHRHRNERTAGCNQIHHDQCGLKEYFCFVYNISCLHGRCKHFPEIPLPNTLTQKYLKEDNKNIETEPLKGPKFRKPRTETQKRWNFALCSLRRLLSDLRPKLARAACSNKGLRSDAMLAHKANSNVSAYSVRGFRNFYLIGSVTIIKTVQS